MIAAAGVLAVVVAVALNRLDPGSDDEAPEATAVPEAATAAGGAAGPAPSGPSAAQTVVVPSFDVVRVNPEGDAVMAGRAEPGRRVIVLDGDHPLGEVQADDRGEWVFIPETPLPPGQHTLSLSMPRDDGPATLSDDEVVLVIPRPGEDVAGRPADQAQPALAMRVSRSGARPTAVLQTPDSPGEPLPIAIDSVDYGADGRVGIGGHSVAGAIVRLYLDGRPLGEVQADSLGVWRFQPAERLPQGTYTLRADQVDARGQVLARASIPFVAQPGLLTVTEGARVVVQPGTSLWRIARETYGRGTAYTVIYTANRSQIEDPDLIYPGQVFHLPTTH